MAGFNRNRSLENAKKHIEKGQLDRAIKELNKVLDDQPDDAATRVQLAGLQAKKGDKAAALENYDKIAEHYAKGKEFDRRAIATYEHMLKIDGTRADVRMKLAKLLEALGRPSDAVREMHIAADQLEQAGKDAELESVLTRMIELDPSDLAARKKLARLTARKGALPDARKELRSLAEHAKETGDRREQMALLERAFQVDPKDVRNSVELAAMYLEREKPKIALARLQYAYQTAPQDPRVLEALMRCFSALGKPEKAKEVARALSAIRGPVSESTLPPIPGPSIKR
jgi:pilus assembly protein FimV